MKNQIITTVTALSAMALLTGCLIIKVGGDSEKKETHKVTTGQQLIDLQKAKDNGVITEAEYQAQRGKILNCK